MSNFLDTNILLYSISENPDDAAKKNLALELLLQDDLVLSVQVLQEFYRNATRPKKGNAMPEQQAAKLVEFWYRYEVVDLTKDILSSAMEISCKNQISYWDAAIIAAAESADCDRVLTEDLNHGQKIGSVQVVNPFIAKY
jgi:predicted nucleic acid-binding protein